MTNEKEIKGPDIVTALQESKEVALNTDTGKVVVVEEKSATMSVSDARITHINSLLKGAYEKASTLQLTSDESEKLSAPFRDEEIEIKPTGEAYIPHIYIRERLTTVLGQGQWTPVVRSTKFDHNTLMVEVVLLVRGVFCGEAWGTMEYIPSNARMDYSDAFEGAQGEAVRRIAAKVLNCGSQVWKPAHNRAWIEKFAVAVWCKNTRGEKRKMWRRKDSPPLVYPWFEEPEENTATKLDERIQETPGRTEHGPAGATYSAPTRTPGDSVPITTPQIGAVNALLFKLGFKEDVARHVHVGGILGREIKSTKDLSKAEGSKVIDILAKELDAKK